MQFLLRLVILCVALARVASRRYGEQPHRHGTRSIDTAESDKLVVEEGNGVQHNPYSKHHTGRHVCSKMDNRSLKTKQAYCKPTYKNYVVRCQGNQVCQGVRLVYETHYKEITPQISNEVILACCPGWTQANNRSHGCNKPVCSKPCLNGGKCVKPELCGCLKGFAGPQCEIVTNIPECSKSCLNGGRCISTDLCSCPKGFGGNQCEINLHKSKCGKGCQNGGTCVQQEFCLCLKGYTGRYCETDVNECREQKPCDQICHNTFGSFFCQCREDFILQSDGQSCRKETDDGGIEAKDLEFELLDKRLHKLETMMSKSHESDVSKNDLENVYKDMNYISKDLSNMKNKINEVENYKNDMNIFKIKLNSIEKKADKVDDLLVKYDRIKTCALYNKICL